MSASMCVRVWVWCWVCLSISILNKDVCAWRFGYISEWSEVPCNHIDRMHVWSRDCALQMSTSAMLCVKRMSVWRAFLAWILSRNMIVWLFCIYFCDGRHAQDIMHCYHTRINPCILFLWEVLCCGRTFLGHPIDISTWSIILQIHPIQYKQKTTTDIHTNHFILSFRRPKDKTIFLSCHTSVWHSEASISFFCFASRWYRMYIA